MMNRFVDVEKEDFCLTVLDDISFCEVDNSSAIDHEEEFDLVVGECLGDACTELGILGDWKDLVLNIFAFKELLHAGGDTERILSVQRESISTAQNKTMDT